MNNQLTSFSRIVLIIAAALLSISLFVPIWSISLDAPQYPEGLGLEIWANKIAGDVDIINGLNHYIGMKTLHTDDFIEFKILPYIIVFFVLLFLMAATIGKKKWLYTVFFSFVLFGIIAMIDFWKWEYDYGHNLDPNAAIKVPGMAYQPPLIGFKQLLNFGAYSIPDTGGWLFVAAGILLIIAILKEKKILNRFRSKTKSTVALFAFSGLLSSCGSKGPEAIVFNKDACGFCKMSITDGRFMAELITNKNRVYKFDDLSCMIQYCSANNIFAESRFYVGNYEKQNELIEANSAWFVSAPAFKSPMAGNTAAFQQKNNAESAALKHQTKLLDWDDIINVFENKNESHNEHRH